MPDEKLGAWLRLGCSPGQMREMNTLALTADRALSFEALLGCWLLEDCSSPAAWAVEDYCPMLLSDLFEKPGLPSPPGSPWLLVPHMAALLTLLSVLTLADERGGARTCTQLSLMPYLSMCWRQSLSVVLLCGAVEGARKSLSEGGSLHERLCHTSLPLSAISSSFGAAGMAGDGAGSFPSCPCLQLAGEDGEGVQPPLSHLCCRKEQPGEFEWG